MTLKGFLGKVLIEIGVMLDRLGFYIKFIVISLILTAIVFYLLMVFASR